MKILSVIYNYCLNGVNTFALTVINQLKRMYNYEFYTYALNKESGILSNYFDNKLSYDEMINTEFDLALIHCPYEVKAKEKYFFVHNLVKDIISDADKIFTFSERAHNYLNYNTILIRNYIDTEQIGYYPTNNKLEKCAVVDRNTSFISDAILKPVSKNDTYLKVIGNDGFNKTTINSFEKMKDIDLIFAVGRTAIEAMAMGKNVYIFNKDNNESLVTPNNFWIHAQTNFSGYIYKKSIYDYIYTLKQLKKYDKNYSRVLSELVREYFDIKNNINKII